MAICTGGSAANNPALGTIEMSGSYLNSVLPGGLQWFDAYLWLIPPFTLDIPAFCSVDPPSLPVLDANDILSIVSGGRLGTLQVGINKGIQLIQTYAWYQLCHCTAMGTPAPPPAQAPPASLPIINPPGVGTNTLGCSTQVADVVTVPPSTFVLQITQSIPAGGKYVDVTMTVNPAGASHGAMQWAYQFFDGHGISIVGNPLLAAVASGATRTDRINVPGAAALFTCSVNHGATTVTDTAQTVAVVQCSLDAPPVIQPTDPQVNGLLRQILSLVTLLQRQLVPFAYIFGAVHAGLSGQGSFAVQGLLGVKVEITTLPPTYPQDVSVPPYIFNAGWVSMETADGFIDEARLHATDQTWLPRIASASVATLIGYSFSPGIIATITEVRREP